MKKFIFPLAAAVMMAVFYLWSPFNAAGDKNEALMESGGKLLIPQRNVAIAAVSLKDANLEFTRARDIVGLRALQEAFIALPGVSKVESILSVSRVILEGDDIIISRAIPPEDEDVTDEYLAELSGEMASFPELAPYISAEQDTLLFYVYYANSISPLEIYRGLKALQAEWPLPFDFTGRAPIIAAAESLLTKDVSLFFPILGIMVIVILSLFRSLMAVFMSLGLMSIAMAASWLFVGFLGIANSPLLLLIPVFSLGLLSDYLIHYFYHRLYSPLTAPEVSLKKLLMFPLSLTALSTLIGFLSLSLINGSGHLQLGILTAFSVALTWLGVFYWCDLAPCRKSAKPLMVHFQRFQGRLFARITKYRYLYFAAIAAALVWGILSLSKITIEPYPIGQLPPATTIKKADAIINDKFFGSVPFFIEIDTGEANGMLKKSAMLELDRIHRAVDKAETGFSYSVLTVLKQMHYYFTEERDTFLSTAQYDDFYDALIEQYLLYFSSGVEPAEYESMADSSYRVFSIKGLIYYRDYNDLDSFIGLLHSLEAEFPENWSMEIHGMARQLETEHNNLRGNWILSFTGGSLLIFIMVLIFYRSLSLAALSLIPGFVSMIISFGFIHLAGISIDVFSIIFVSIITGLVIDYSIHTLAALNHLGDIQSLEGAFSEIIGFSGIPIFLSFLTSLLSFSVLFLSSFRGARSLGFLLFVSLVLSFFFSLYLIPLIILPIKLNRRKTNG
ncbi:MAG: hypothetical protein B0D92_03905 [Spirochaeta sp. LUC14_002_19_P3]|nr:MAG: hypothetical protein B0D92_03905 [Spirochaeta sp. LUC14_002_19_P3]